MFRQLKILNNSKFAFSSNAPYTGLDGKQNA